MKSFKALSALLSYPSADLQAVVPEIREILYGEGLFGPRRLAALEPLLEHVAGADLMDLQEEYVFLFDRSRSLSLNLFEHVHGEGRDRGSAMVDLLETYREAGFDLAGSELPDHLPVLLEFVSTLGKDEARAILADAGAILVALAERLTRRESLFAPVLTALADFAEAELSSAEAAALMAEEIDDPADLAALDATYAEAQVVFGPDPNAGCPATREILGRMDPPRPVAAE